MSYSNYKSSSRDIFADDIEDDTFLRHSPSGPYVQSGCQYPNYDSLEEKRQELLRRKKEIEDRSLMSTERSLSYLKNSEEVGIAAAEELLRQREQLERTERSLDNINTTLRFSQKHIQGIKSVFSGLKSFFGGRQNETLPEMKSPDTVESPLNEHLAARREENRAHMEDHVGLRLRGQVEQEESSQSMEHQDRISRNLDDMLGSIYKLKGLAHGLGDEIESHNQLIENVIVQTERADDSLRRQNKDINKLLKKN